MEPGTVWDLKSVEQKQKHSLFQDEVGHFWSLLTSFQRKEMCRTLLKPEYLMQKQTEGRLSHTSAWEQTESHAMPRVNNICSKDGLHDDFPSSFFIAPRCCFIVLSFRVCIPLLLGKYKYPPFIHKNLRQGLLLHRLGPALIHPSAVPLVLHTGPPKLCSPPPA